MVKEMIAQKVTPKGMVLVKELVPAEIDVSEPERNPLFGAICAANKEIVNLLLDAGMDTSIKYTGQNMKDMSAYEFAKERGQLEIADLIVARTSNGHRVRSCNGHRVRSCTATTRSCIATTPAT